MFKELIAKYKRIPARERVIQQALGASTAGDIRAARQALRQWCDEHPDDQGIMACHRVLNMLEETKYGGRIPDVEFRKDGMSQYAIASALGQWEQRSIQRLQQGQPLDAPFGLDTLPEATYERIIERLDQCTTTAELEALFRAEVHWITLNGRHIPLGAKVGDAHPGPAPAVETHYGLSLEPGVTEALAEWTGRGVLPHEVGQLVGAPSGSDVEASFIPDQNTILIQTTHPLYRSLQIRRVVNDPERGLVIHNDLTHLQASEQRKGYGTHILAAQVSKARELGVKRLVAYADRTGKLVGYLVWPLLGFDAEIPARKRPLLGSLSGARTVGELVRSEAGRRWWETHGERIRCMFDLDPRSESSRRLEAYLQTRGLQR